ncbi:MAG TPA: hypothetical protein VFZ16_10130 [Hyphomicrobiaceae bacterium]|nr:hypothetical protein [Hyphomicrobiaceae bacterium]
MASSTHASYYALESAVAPWGDYGNTLWTGWTEEGHEPGQPTILVTRTGRFVPPITLPFGRVVVTDEFRRKLVAQRITSLAFEASD